MPLEVRIRTHAGRKVVKQVDGKMLGEFATSDQMIRYAARVCNVGELDIAMCTFSQPTSEIRR